MVSLRTKQRNVCCFSTILVSIRHSVSDHVGTYKNLTLKSAIENKKMIIKCKYYRKSENITEKGGNFTKKWHKRRLLNVFFRTYSDTYTETRGEFFSFYFKHTCIEMN